MGLEQVDNVRNLGCTFSRLTDGSCNRDAPGARRCPHSCRPHMIHFAPGLGKCGCKNLALFGFSLPVTLIVFDEMQEMKLRMQQSLSLENRSPY